MSQKPPLRDQTTQSKMSDIENRLLCRHSLRAMTKFLSLSLLATTCILLTSCGFKPMYGDHSTSSVTATELASIRIGNIPNRNGQVLRNELVDRLNASGQPDQPLYELKVLNLKEQIRDLDITIRSDTTREQMKVSALMQLIDKRTGEVVLEKDLSSRGSYNILESEYTSRVSRQDLRRDLIENVAEQIERYLSIYFSNQ